MTNVITKAFTSYLKRNVFGNHNADSRNINPSKAQKDTWAEFAHVAKASLQIRTALWGVSKNISDRTMIARLSKQLFTIIRTDKLNPRGCRKVNDGEPGLLEGFQFNALAHLNRVFHAPYKCHIERANGSLVIDIPSFDPSTSLNMPANVTHFKLLSGAAEIDFFGNHHIADIQQTCLLPIHRAPCRNIRLRHTVTPGTKHPLILALAIEPYYVDTAEYRSWDKRYNAGGIVKISG